MLEFVTKQNVDGIQQFEQLPTLHGSTPTPQGQAENVLRQLEQYSCPHRTLFSQEHKNHTVFARLYFHTTSQWLAHLEEKSDPRIIYLLMAHFFALYDSHVAQVLNGDHRRVPMHWRTYLKTGSSSPKDNGYIKGMRLIYLGARAHVRYDLADAIAATCQSHRTIYGEEPDMERFRQILLSPETDRVFIGAAQAYVAERAQLQNLASNSLILNISTSLQILWLPIFQLWRRAAWSDAMAWLECDQQPVSDQLYSKRYH